MLYERWLQTVRHHRDETALTELESRRRWTFAQLASEAAKPARSEPLFFPSGHGVSFVLTVLRAWRTGAVVCPLEAGQSVPILTAPPAGCVHLKTTSATTGAPRFVAFTGEQLAADASNIVATMGLRPDWPNLGAISLAHSYGFSNLVLPLLLHGIPLILPGSSLPEAMRRALEVHKAVTLPAVPALWRTWLDAGILGPSARLAISAGAPLPLALEKETFERIGIKIHNFYGSTECGGIAYDRTETPRADASLAGSPLENVRLSRTPEGCLEVRGAAVGQSYWPEPDSALGNGMFQTSDMAELKDGLVFLRGRLGEQINVAGRKVAPETIERALSQHPEVRDCLVFGVQENGTGRNEIIVACVAGTDTLSTEALRRFLLQTLPAWQVPREWVRVESLAANIRGKLSRAEWRRKFLERKAE